MFKPSVTIVIPAYNSEGTVLNALRSALDQSYGHVEVIAVDDGSTDKTGKVMRSVPGVRCFRQNNAGPASARNLGARQAQGDFIFFTDADCVPRRTWIETAVRHFREPDVAVVAGSYGIVNPDFFLARCIHAEIVYRHRRRMPRNPRSFGSYNFGIKKEVFRSLGGFDETYPHASGEDNDLSYKVLKGGYRIHFEPDAIVDHAHQINVWRYFKEQFRHGYWRVQMYADHPDMAKGDDYTFWKDMAEVPLSLLAMAGGLLSLHNSAFFLYAFLPSLLAMFILEIYFACIMIKGYVDAFFYACVMLLRAFARSLGFSSGIFHLWLSWIRKKVK